MKELNIKEIANILQWDIGKLRYWLKEFNIKGVKQKGKGSPLLYKIDLANLLIKVDGAINKRKMDLYQNRRSNKVSNKELTMRMLTDFAIRWGKDFNREAMTIDGVKLTENRRGRLITPDGNDFFDAFYSNKSFDNDRLFSFIEGL